MFTLFNFKSKTQPVNQAPQLSSLDGSLYPIQWQTQSFESATVLLLYSLQELHSIQELQSLQELHSLQEFDYIQEHLHDREREAKRSQGLAKKVEPKSGKETEQKREPQSQQQPQQLLSDKLADLQQQFSQCLQANKVYQDWINFTVFGRYVQRSFSAFYRQSEDAFNADMPELLRHELMRHTQRLPVEQVLFFGGKLPTTTRQEKLLLTTLNPFNAIADALKDADNDSLNIKKGKRQTLDTSLIRSNKALIPNQVESNHDSQQLKNPIIINVITAKTDQVKAFAIKHNKRTREGLRNEVMILDFNHLTLVKETPYVPVTHLNDERVKYEYLAGYLIRYYTIG